MSSMSPPPPTNASSPAAPSPAKKARANGGGGPGPGRPKKNKTAATGGDGADGSTTATKTTKGKAAGGTGAGRGRKKRQSTVDSPGVSTPNSAGIAFNPNTPGGASSHAPSPAAGGIAGIASMLEDEARMAREGSQASGSASRKGGAAAAGRSNAGNRDTTTVAGEDDDEEEEEEEEEEDEFLNDNDYDEQAKERAEAKEALRMLVDQFSPEQFRRYEVYRGARLQSAPIRRLINHVLQQSCSPNIIIAVRGLSKVFVGEIVELARQVQTEANETGPLTPDHFREAYVRYKAVGDKRGSSRAKLFVR